MAKIIAGRRHWKEHWANQKTPQHARESEQDYQALAGELRLLFAPGKFDRVLEIGCGNGALFIHLGFDAIPRYVGIDFSHSMLAEFSVRFPQLDLLAVDGADFCSAEKFDLVFSSHVVQYWDRGQLARHLDHAESMIEDDGLIVLAGIPWSRMRLAYARGDLTGGDLTGGKRRSLPTAALGVVRELTIPDIGHWYDFPELKKLAAARNLGVTFRGSGHYPYRFHAIFTKRHEASAGSLRQERSNVTGQ